MLRTCAHVRTSMCISLNISTHLLSVLRGVLKCYINLDCRSGKCTKVIVPEKDEKSQDLISCVGCVALDASESWLVRF